MFVNNLQSLGTQIRVARQFNTKHKPNGKTSWTIPKSHPGVEADAQTVQKQYIIETNTW